jgi:Zn finger protein HypA/HybF involved in hydrogenase expression
MNAIANNGDVEILFYEEETNVGLKYYPTWNPPTYIYNDLNTPIGNNFYTTSVNYSSNMSKSSVTLDSLTNDNTLNFFNNNPRSSKYESKYDQKPRSRSFAKKSKSVETGRVEEGSSSNQSFKTVSKNFNSWTVSTSIWKILPESQKPIEKKDLIERCPKCSTKIKKSSWKFCPECGNELKQETLEDQLNKLSKEELIELLKNK